MPRSELVGGVIGDKYAIKGILGEGGMGVVYEAEHMAMGRTVAIKVLHPENAQKREAVTRLQHEAKVTGNLGHPNICEIYDMGRLEDGSPYVVMERLRGETLAQKIKDLGRVEPAPVVEIAMQVLSALGAAHASGIIHRDLKPENVFLADKPGGLVVTKLLDFGISKAIFTGDEEGLGLTQTGMVMGTPYYMAPEQARGDRALDHRVDLWAVGVMMYEAMTGRRPFLAKNYNALLVKILTVWHRSLAEVDPTIPPALALVVDKALSKMPEDRYQSAADMQEALKRFLPRKEISYPASFALAPAARPTEPLPPAKAQGPAPPQAHPQTQAPPQAQVQAYPQTQGAPQVPVKPQAPPQPQARSQPQPPTFGLPELDLHDETATDGVPWTAVKQYVATSQREAVSAAIAEARAHAAAPPPPAAPPHAAPPPPAAAPAHVHQATSAVPTPRPTPVMHVAPSASWAPASAGPPSARRAPAAPSPPAGVPPRPTGPSAPSNAPTPSSAPAPHASGLPVPPRAARRVVPSEQSAAPFEGAPRPVPRPAPAIPFHAPTAQAPAAPRTAPSSARPATPAGPPRPAIPQAAAPPPAGAPPPVAQSPQAPSPSPSRPAARVSQQGRQMRPLPQFSYEPKRPSEPPPAPDDDATMLEEPSDDADDDSETLVLVRDKLSLPKKQP